MVLKDKSEFRNYVFKKRDSFDQGLRLKYDDDIYDRFINSRYYKDASTIFTFVSFRTEVDTKRIINTALADGKTILVPKIKTKATGIEIFKINSLDELKTGYFGVLEPIGECPKVDPNDIDFILMPGVAFDRKGNRIGYGAGFYDRFLMKLNKKVPKIAIAYDFQIFDSVPTNEMDVRIDGIMTNKELILAEE